MSWSAGDIIAYPDVTASCDASSRASKSDRVWTGTAVDYWAADSSNPPASDGSCWFQIVFGSVQKIAGVQIQRYGNNTFPADIVVKTSTSGAFAGEEATVGSFTCSDPGTNAWCDEIEWTSAEVLGVRIEIHSEHSGSGYVTVREVRFYSPFSPFSVGTGSAASAPAADVSKLIPMATGSAASAPAAGFERAFFVDMGSGASVSVPAADVSKLIPMATGSAASAPAAGFEQAFFVDMATGASVSVPAADVSKLIPMATGSAASAPAADVSRLFPMGTGSAASEFSATATVPIFVELALVYGLEASADLEIVYNLSEIVTSELEIVYNLRAMGFFELEMKYDLLDSTPVFVELPIIYSLMAGAGDPGSGIQFGDFVYDSTHVI